MVVELCGLQGGQGEGGGLGVVDGERGLLEAGCLQWQRGAVKGNITCMARLSEQIGQRSRQNCKNQHISVREEIEPSYRA